LEKRHLSEIGNKILYLLRLNLLKIKNVSSPKYFILDFTNPLVFGVPCFIAFILLELVYSKTHGDDELYEWKDLFASGTMGVGSVFVAPLMKLISAIVIFKVVYEFCNPLIDGVRVNFLGYESFGYVWYVWLICFSVSPGRSETTNLPVAE